MGVSMATYEQVALEDGDTIWEYVCGRLREKPGMTQDHNDAAGVLTFLIQSQLDLSAFRVRNQSGRLKTSAGNAFVPDVTALPRGMTATQHGTGKLEVYEQPVPFVAETWSKSTGDYDSNTKIPEYRSRGDPEIWRVQPYERLVTAWRRQPDGSYVETVHREGPVPIESLPGVAIDLETLFS
jgi:Uma2 family endonuclease